MMSMADGFRERYEAAVEYLLGSLPPGCGMSGREINTGEKHYGVRLPAALRDYYLGVGNLRRLNEAHNRLLAPNRSEFNLLGPLGTAPSLLPREGFSLQAVGRPGEAVEGGRAVERAGRGADQDQPPRR
jgi:hypothetical protein